MGKDGKELIDGVTDDDLTVDANDTDTDDIDDTDDTEDVDLEELLKDISEDEEDSDEESDEEETEEVDEQQETEPKESDEERFNRRVIEEVNRIIPERLRRDRKTQVVANIEQLTGMTLEQVSEQILNNMVEDMADSLGISDEEAREQIMQKYELAQIKADNALKKQEQEEVNAAMQSVKYLQDKQNYLRNPKLTRLLQDNEAEIDAFTQNGAILSFEDGMKYILGAKLANGELLQKIQAGAEQKTMRRKQKQGKAAPQTKSSGSKSGATTLTKEQRAYAANLGVSDKDYAKEYLNIKNSKKNRSR